MSERGERPPGYVPPDLSDYAASWRGEEVRYHYSDLSDRELVYPGRRVLELPGRTWPAARPEECADADSTGEWVVGGRVLVCRGCGLDCT